MHLNQDTHATETFSLNDKISQDWGLVDGVGVRLVTVTVINLIYFEISQLLHHNSTPPTANSTRKYSELNAEPPDDYFGK